MKIVLVLVELEYLLRSAVVKGRDCIAAALFLRFYDNFQSSLRTWRWETSSTDNRSCPDELHTSRTLNPSHSVPGSVKRLQPFIQNPDKEYQSDDAQNLPLIPVLMPANQRRIPHSTHLPISS